MADYILRNSSARVQELAELYDVSTMTIHRDLDELERQGIIRKVRGGATAQPSSLFESDVRYRINIAVKEKQAIARAAFAYIEPGQAVMIDDSTTALALARLLINISHLTVITNCLAIMRELSSARNIRLIALGGEYLPRYEAFTGIICEQTISSLRANILFASTSAVAGHIAFHQAQEIVKVKRAMMDSTEQHILMLDHNKLGKFALHRLSPLSAFDRVIIDSGVDQAMLHELEEAQTQIEVAPL